MNPPTEQLIRDYLNRLSRAARDRLGFADRQALLDQVRARIEADCGGSSRATPAQVRMALARLGDAFAVVEGAHAKVAAGEDILVAASGPGHPPPGPVLARHLLDPPVGADDHSAMPGRGAGANGMASAGRPLLPRMPPLLSSPPPPRPAPAPGSPPADHGDPPPAQQPLDSAAQPAPGDGAEPGHPGAADFGGVRTALPVAPPAPAGTGSVESPDARDGTGPAERARLTGALEQSVDGGADICAGGLGPDGDSGEDPGPPVSRREPPLPDEAATPGGAPTEPGGAAERGEAPESGGTGSAPGGDLVPGSGGAAGGDPPPGETMLPEIPPVPPGEFSLPSASASAIARWWPGRDSAGPLMPRAVSPSFGRATARLAMLARSHKLEAVAILLLGVGGVIYQPVWLLGAILALASREWDARDKWTALAASLLLLVVGTVAVVVFGTQYSSVASYAGEAWRGADWLSRALALLSAGYLLRRLSRGRRTPKLPPWNIPHRFDV